VSDQQSNLGLVWEQVVQELSDGTLSPQQRAWMRVTRPIGLLDGTALLAAPSDFAKEAIERALRDPITAALSRRLGKAVSLAVKVDAAVPRPVPAAVAEPDELEHLAGDGADGAVVPITPVVEPGAEGSHWRPSTRSGRRSRATPRRTHRPSRSPHRPSRRPHRPG